MNGQQAQFNPYHPPAERVIEASDSDAPLAVTFCTDTWLRTHARDQYLLHWHPFRLFIGSVVMIFISGICLFSAVPYGVTVFVPTMFIVMLAATGGYLALIRGSKKRLEQRLSEFGLNNDEPMTIHLDPDQLTLESVERTFHWPYERLRIHRARRGLLVCPEPLLFIFVPKRSDFPLGGYRQFVQELKSRAKSTSGESSTTV
jgi:hypothetical protein